MEEQLAQAVLSHLQDCLPQSFAQDTSIDVISKAQQALENIGKWSSTDDRHAILACIDRVAIAPGRMEISLDRDRIARLVGIEPTSMAADWQRFHIPFQFRKRGVESKLVIGAAQARQHDATLIRSIAKAQQYYEAVRQGASFEEIAASEKLSKRRILQVIDLAFLAPDIVKSVVQGDQPVGLTAKWLGQYPLPADWRAQRRIISTR